MDSITISFLGELSLIKEFYGFLQSGFLIICHVGTSIENLFYEQLAFDSRLVEEKVSTIFLDGKPVDDISKTTVQDGSVLALSGAMPGLVGATLRRKSPLSSFRQSISAGTASAGPQKNEGYIRIKLFNVLINELGPAFLRRGIFIETGVFLSFITQQTTDFWGGCKQTIVNGESTQARTNAEWISLLSGHEFIFLKVAKEQ